MNQQKSDHSKIYIINIKKEITKNKDGLESSKRDLTFNILKQILSVELNVPSSSLVFVKNIHGKPFLKSNNRYFNISYSSDLVAIATDNKPIGIDIEKIVPIEDTNDLIKYFSKAEQKAYYQLKQEERLEFFFTLWTLNESYVKAIGRGLSCSLNSFSICCDQKTLSTKGSSMDNANWFFHTYDINIDGFYKCSLCKKIPTFPEEPYFLEIDQLFSEEL